MVFIPHLLGHLGGFGEVELAWCRANKAYTNNKDRTTKLKKTQTQQIGGRRHTESHLRNTFEFQCVWGYGRRGGKVTSLKKLLKKQLQVWQPELIQPNIFSAAAYGCVRALESEDMDHLIGTIPPVQPDIPSSTFFIISAKEIPVRVPRLSPKKHGI